MATRARPAQGRRHRGLVIAAFAAVYAIWGSTYLFIRVAVETLPPLLMAGVRFLLAGTILAAFSWRGRGAADDPIGPRQWMAAALTGGLLLLGGNGVVSFGEQYVSSGIVALLVATVPLWVAVLGAALLRHRVQPRTVAGVVVGLAGTAALIAPGAGGGADAGHMLLVLLAPLCWAAGSLCATRAPLPRRALLATSMEMLCGGALLLLVGLATGELGALHLDRVSLASTISVVYLVLAGSLVAFSAYVWLLTQVSTTAAATYAYVNPLVAVLLGWAVLGEPITAATLLAGGLIIVAVVLILSSPPTDRAAAAPDVPLGDVA